MEVFKYFDCFYCQKVQKIKSTELDVFSVISIQFGC
jgi:hypothetical protein